MHFADNSGGVRDLLNIDSGNAHGADMVAQWFRQRPAKAPHGALTVLVGALPNSRLDGLHVRF